MKKGIGFSLFIFLILGFGSGIAEAAGKMRKIKRVIIQFEGIAHGRGHRGSSLEDEKKAVAHSRHLLRLKEGREATIPNDE